MSKCPNIPNIYYSQKELKYFGLEILLVWEVLGHLKLYQVFMCLNWVRYFLIYILGENVSKNQTRKVLKYIKSPCIFLGQNNTIFIKIFELYQVFVWENVSKLPDCILVMQTKGISLNCLIFANVMNNATIATVIMAILLILRHKIVKSWQPLHTESWNLNPGLQNQKWKIMHSLLLLLLAGPIPLLISILL